MTARYAELHCLSNFTFLRGASHPEELVTRAHALGYHALALTDECSFAGIVRAHVAARPLGLKLVIGTELRLAGASPLALVLLAPDRTAYGNLAELITRGRRNAAKGEYHLTRDEVAAASAGCLALWLPARVPDETDARWMQEHFAGRAWIAVELLGQAGDRPRLDALRTLGHRLGLPCVAAGDVHMHVRARRALQDTLTAIRLRCTLAEAGYHLHPNGERHLRPLERLARIHPPELLAETVAIAQRCTFSLDELRYEYPQELVPEGCSPAGHLRTLVARGFAQRFGEPLDAAAQAPHHPAPPPGLAKARALIAHELALIAELAYEPYFLTVHDIVAFARARGILCQGRGSAANSAVCYCLGITEVDPARMQMLFERFISRERNEPPDIDVDFEHQRREEVMQYVYAKYGRERAGLAATLITYRAKSAIRDVGKALGLDLAQVDRLAKARSWWDGREVAPERIREAGLDPDSPIVQRMVALTGMLIGFPRHLSQHVGGFVISRGPLTRLVPIENAAMKDRTVIQWDKDDLDALGLLKVDCLALGMLSAIRRALDLVTDWRDRKLAALPPLRQTSATDAFALADIPAEDAATYAMICKADTVGVFQIESRAQMAMLPRLAPRTFYDLVIEVAIVRPGPIQGGMVHPYLRRRQGIEPVTYPSPAVQEVLARTLGVPIFQEQVMQLAIVAAGFTPGEADQLRRSMAAWRRKGGLWHFEERLVAGMGERGYPEQFARQIFQQILGFGEYGFPESHAASFALLVYVSAWLKRHAPAAFAAALLDSQPMGFYAPSQLVQDARRHGVEVRPVDVAVSDWNCALEPPGRAAPCPPHAAQTRTRYAAAPVESAMAQYGRDGPALRLGLRLVSGLAEEAARRIVAARAQAPFADVDDLARRALLDRRALNCLAAADALASLAGHRRNATWQVTGIEALPPVLAHSRIDETLPLLPAPSEGREIVADYAHLGLTLRRHPLALLRDEFTRRRLVSAEAVRTLPHGRLARAAGIVTCRQRPDTASGVVFITMEDETGTVNVVVWRSLIERQRREVLGARLLAVYGHIEREGEVVHLIAGRLADLSSLLGDLPSVSRDFH
jgi:error-prone DNA polymerase